MMSIFQKCSSSIYPGAICFQRVLLHSIPHLLLYSSSDHPSHLPRVVHMPVLVFSAGNRSRSTYFEHDIISTEVIQRQHAVRSNPMIGNLHYGRFFARIGFERTHHTFRTRDPFKRRTITFSTVHYITTAVGVGRTLNIPITYVWKLCTPPAVASACTRGGSLRTLE